MDHNQKLSKIKPISTLSLVDKVEIRLQEYLKDNNLLPGDTLPKELEIAESLGVSRTVVREALLRLRTLGLIESRKHRGMILTNPDVLGPFQRMPDPQILSEETLKDIFELRLALEMGMAELLFANKSEQSLNELEKIVIKGEKQGEIVGFEIEHELAFHGQLYKMTGNETLRRFQSLLFPVFKYVHESGIFQKDYSYRHGYVTHRHLLETLRQGDPESFRKDMRDHLEPHFARVFGEDV